MDIYFKKYLKYKYKYINLLYQKGGEIGVAGSGIKNVSDLLDTNKEILTNHAVVINNTIYDFVIVLNYIISGYMISKSKSNYSYPKDPKNNKLINISDLELIYKKARYQSIHINYLDENMYNQIIIKSIEQYYEEIKKIVNLITNKIKSIKPSIIISNTINLNLIDLQKLNDLLDKNQINNESQLLFILQQPFNYILKILLLNLTNEDQINNFIKHVNNKTNILELTINQINKLLSYDLENQNKILKLNDKDKIEYFLLINNINNKDNFNIDIDIDEAKTKSLSINLFVSDITNLFTGSVTDIADLEVINTISTYNTNTILNSIKKYRIEEKNIVDSIKSRLPNDHLTFNLDLNLIYLQKLNELLKKNVLKDTYISDISKIIKEYRIEEKEIVDSIKSKLSETKQIYEDFKKTNNFKPDKYLTSILNQAYFNLDKIYDILYARLSYSNLKNHLKPIYKIKKLNDIFDETINCIIEYKEKYFKIKIKTLELIKSIKLEFEFEFKLPVEQEKEKEKKKTRNTRKKRKRKRKTKNRRKKRKRKNKI